MKKNKKPSLILRLLKYLIGGVVGLVIAVLKTIFVDLFKNIRLYIIMATNKEEREKIRRKLDMEKEIKLLNIRLKVVERLLYSVFNDPSYTKRDEGKIDMDDLEKEAKK